MPHRPSQAPTIRPTSLGELPTAHALDAGRIAIVPVVVLSAAENAPESRAGAEGRAGRPRRQDARGGQDGAAAAHG